MNHKFWNTQPVKHNITDNITDTITNTIRNEPYKLIDGFYWDIMNLDNDLELDDLYVFLNENYVEDSDNLFRFDYSKEFLKWALASRAYTSNILLCVRSKQHSNKIVGTITGTVIQLCVDNEKANTLEINFLCIHKKLRHMRLTPVLIKEMTRKAKLINIHTSIYTSGSNIHLPVCVSQYWHRNLNTVKLIDIGFSPKEAEAEAEENKLPILSANLVTVVWSTLS